MYVPIYQIATYDPKERDKVRERWDSEEGQRFQSQILAGIAEGAGEDFLQWDFETTDLGSFLDDMWDLRGIVVQSVNVDRSGYSWFESLDFAYAMFYNCTFCHCEFTSNFHFARFYGCVFRNCIFRSSEWLGCEFENCSFEETDFIEDCQFSNCNFSETTFAAHFASNVLFTDCKFSSTVSIDNPAKRAITPEAHINLNTKILPDYYLGIREAFKSGGIHDRAREFLYKAQSARTRYNHRGLWDYLYRKLFLELLTGYGVKPFRALASGVVIALIFSGVYCIHIKGFYSSLITSVHAILTMGDAYALPFPFSALYLAEGFLGILVAGLYLTTLVSVWFDEQ